MLRGMRGLSYDRSSRDRHRSHDESQGEKYNADGDQHEARSVLNSLVCVVIDLVDHSVYSRMKGGQKRSFAMKLPKLSHSLIGSAAPTLPVKE